MVSLVNSHTNATRIGWHLWGIDLRFAPVLLPGLMGVFFFPVRGLGVGLHLYLLQGYLAHTKQSPLP